MLQQIQIFHLLSFYFFFYSQPIRLDLSSLGDGFFLPPKLLLCCAADQIETMGHLLPPTHLVPSRSLFLFLKRFSLIYISFHQTNKYHCHSNDFTKTRLFPFAHLYLAYNFFILFHSETIRISDWFGRRWRRVDEGGRELVENRFRRERGGSRGGRREGGGGRREGRGREEEGGGRMVQIIWRWLYQLSIRLYFRIF